MKMGNLEAIDQTRGQSAVTATEIIQQPTSSRHVEVWPIHLAKSRVWNVFVGKMSNLHDLPVRDNSSKLVLVLK